MDNNPDLTINRHLYAALRARDPDVRVHHVEAALRLLRPAAPNTVLGVLASATKPLSAREIAAMLNLPPTVVSARLRSAPAGVTILGRGVATRYTVAA